MRLDFDFGDRRRLRRRARRRSRSRCRDVGAPLRSPRRRARGTASRSSSPDPERTERLAVSRGGVRPPRGLVADHASRSRAIEFAWGPAGGGALVELSARSRSRSPPGRAAAAARDQRPIDRGSTTVRARGLVRASSALRRPCRRRPLRRPAARELAERSRRPPAMDRGRLSGRARVRRARRSIGSRTDAAREPSRSRRRDDERHVADRVTRPSTPTPT